MHGRLLTIALLIGASLAQPARSDEPANQAAGEQLFVRRVQPLLRAKCAGCHGADRDLIEGSLDVTSAAGLTLGGDSGQAAVMAGKPEQSPLLRAVLRDDDNWSAMPPKEAERLSREQIGWLRDWISAGAPWPSDARQKEIAAALAGKWSAEDGVKVRTSGGLSDEWTDRRYRPEGLWAYRPVKKPDRAALTAAAADSPPAGNPIDQLLAARVPAGLRPAPRADRRTLIRRATLDLTGLPPTPDEVSAFLAEPDSDERAFARLVDRLLESPHYGERMAQHWLDVVRYADSSGLANDYERGNAWRYRDYVVRSFNSDKPYDQFILEQLAGDEIDAANPELLVATGFLRMGPWELTGMEVAQVARQRFLDDVTNAMGETFLAHSLQCARCHDHKFDPVPTRDYYALQAVFATTQLAERPAAFLPRENTAGFDERRYLLRRRAEYQQVLAELDDVLLENAQRWLAENRLPAELWNQAVEQARKRGAGRGVFNSARDILTRQGTPEDQFPPKLVGFTPREFGLERVARKGLERLAWELDRYEPFALAVYNGRTPQVKSVNAPLRVPADRLTAGELEETCILAGGDPFSPADPVRPGALSVLEGGELAAATIPDTIEGRRLALARWIASPRNPLTTRAIVNRVWLWHFGEPLAGNPNNFGSTGKRPTHPELLDWLAATFVEDGWSLKALHRRILNSSAWCRASEHPAAEALAQLDPLGTSYAVFRPRRLSAEEIRDGMLAVSGELNRALGGIPCRPEINQEVALQPRQVMGTFAAAWTANPLPADRHRRTLYVLRLRGLADPLLEVFNSPAPDFSCERRETSTVAPQVFSLLNGRNTHARALALAARALRETADDQAALTRVFELAYGRPPNDDELAACLRHWAKIEELLPERAASRERPPLVVRREAVEENTGERFTFDEPLYAHADFVPDLQPADVDRHARALADVCLAILNSNEFVYVY
ncbi:MAG: PSD1 domain-containing protein [Pirellulaceae bacterium]|nr:PSD1 domain-containing protein [Pirellulaceae bacterium]